MKNRLLPLFVVLGSYSAYSQVGIGTLTPNKSAQLEVVSNDKGILIPQVKLTSTTDTASITSGNVNSLLVFATDVIGDIKPGYYYWYVDKWWRLGSSSDGAACCPTTAIGEGVPGSKGEPGYPGTSIAIYTDSKTGDMYVQNPDGTWTMFSGKNGIDGKNGIAGGNGLPGDKGLDATIEMYIDYNTGVVYVRDPKDKTKWIKVSGKDGINGGNGAPGTNGVSIPSNTNFYIDNSTGTLYVLTPGTDPDVKENWIPVNGKNGIDGKNGIAGGNGVPGASGTAGIDGSIEMYIDYNTGIVYVRDPKDKTKWVQLNGKDGINGGDGAPGADGVSIPADSNIYIDNSTGTVYILKPGTDPEDPANWIPLNGKTGNNGKDGINGGNGAPGADGVSIPAETTIYIDKSTGTVYILTPGTDPNVPANWIPVNGKNGMDGKNGISGGKGLPGDAGLDATIQMYVDYQTGIVYVRDPEDDTKWVALNGKNGIDGKNGIAGGNGVPGASGTAGIDGSIEMYIDYDTGIVYVRDPKNKENWIKLGANETLTTLTNNGSGSYTYKNEAGTEVTIDILNDVANNFQTIVNKPGVTTIIENIVKKTGGNVSYDAITKKFSYIDASGNSQVIDISDLVKASETLTSLTYDATTKKLTYKDEKANPNQIDLSSVAVVPQQVIQEFPANGGETSFTLTDTPSTLSSVKLYINGVRISKNAITLTGTLLNYNDANNGSYIIKANDNIMIDYLK